MTEIPQEQIEAHNKELLRLREENRRITATLSERDELIAGLVGALRGAEWGDLTIDGWGKMIERCPICDHRRENGHSKDCMLAAALADPRLAATSEE